MLIIIVVLFIISIPYCRLIMLAIVKDQIPLLWIGQNIIVIGRIRSRPQNILKVVITTQIEKSSLPVKRHLHTCQSCINKEVSSSLRHTLTCSLRSKFHSCSWRRERERERGAFLGEDFLYLFELSLGIVLAIYNKEVLLGFLPHEGFPG
jgi:hypothetical protein